MISVTVTKGYDLPISGRPSPEVKTLKKPLRVASLPERIPFIKPRLQVEVHDPVRIGSVLYEDKQNTDLKFLSPGSGTVTAINFGERRVLREIVIELDREEQVVDFPKIADSDIRSLERESLIRMLMQGGVWPLIRELPFRNIADPKSSPSSIWVVMDSGDPFQASPEVYLRGREALFSFGLKIIKRLGIPVNVSVPDHLRLLGISEKITHRVRGPYPAYDPGVVLYQTKKSASENVCWYLTGQDLLAIASLMKNGKYPVERIVAAGGSRVTTGCHFQTRTGVPIRDMIPELADDTTCVAGGLLTGYVVDADSFLGLHETSLFCMDKGDRPQLFGFLRPGLTKHSYSRTFLSVFRKRSFDMDSGMHGEERACVNCGSCIRICPVDILPQFTIKCLAADAIEEALAHGLLDCVECGLCSYVCPSKIELREILRKAKHDYYMEQK
ncbi:MAG: 4Fe-4S dicluster domain-containing protein [Pseudomonadota bacterium]